MGWRGEMTEQMNGTISSITSILPSLINFAEKLMQGILAANYDKFLYPCNVNLA